jgi:hypothetical protein
MPTILLKGNTTAAPVPRPAGVAIREPIFARGGFDPGDMPPHTGGNDLAINNGAGVVPLVSPSRQVELIGAQRITGLKTFDLLSLSILGGAPGQVLTTNGAGALSWGAAAGPGGPTYNFRRGLTETAGDVDLDIAGNAAGALGGVWIQPVAASGLDLAAGGELSLAVATAGRKGGVFVPDNNGLVLGANGQLTLAIAQAGQLGGVSVPAGGGLQLTGSALSVFAANRAEVSAGTDNAKPITALMLQLGPDPATLPTTAKTLVGAITEIHGVLARVSGVLTIVGTYDAAADDVLPITGSPLQPGALPPASAARLGFFLIVDTAGTGTGNAPPVAMVPGDMVVCVEDAGVAGTYRWGISASARRPSPRSMSRLRRSPA